jgi:uncharacterized membrane protein YqjE
MKQDAPQQPPGVTDLVAKLVDGLGQLIAQHVTLARIELGEEARSVSRSLGTLAVFTPLLVVGYAMLCFGVAFALSPVLSMPGAVLLVGAVNLVVGGIGLWRVIRVLKRPHLEDSAAAVRESTRLLATEAGVEVGGVH